MSNTKLVRSHIDNLAAHVTDMVSKLEQEIVRCNEDNARLKTELDLAQKKARLPIVRYPDLSNGKYVISDRLMIATGILRNVTKTALAIQLIEANAVIEDYKKTMTEAMAQVERTYQSNKVAIAALVSGIEDADVANSVRDTLTANEDAQFNRARSRISDSLTYLSIAQLSSVGNAANAAVINASIEEDAIKNNPAFMIVRYVHKLDAIAGNTLAIRNLSKSEFETIVRTLFDSIPNLFRDAQTQAALRKAVSGSEFHIQNFRVQMYRIRNACSCAYTETNVGKLTAIVSQNFQQVMPLLMALITDEQKPFLKV